SADEAAWEGEGASSDEEEDSDDSDDDRGPVEMSAAPGGEGEGEGGGDDTGNREQPSGTIAPPATTGEGTPTANAAGGADRGPRGRPRRGRRGGRFRRRPREGGPDSTGAGGPDAGGQPGEMENIPDSFHQQVSDEGISESDRADIATSAGPEAPQVEGDSGATGRPTDQTQSQEGGIVARPTAGRAEFRAQRSRDRRIRPKSSPRGFRAQVNIQDLLKEGQEVLVQVAKDPIATKGARLTCHISLPGRHLVCMPTIDHVGVSRRIDRDDERRRLREYVDRNRPKNLGFIVRTATASGKVQSERRIKQDIDYLSNLWTEIREKAATVSAPALVYEDLNVVLRAIRDWVTEDIDKIIVDSRYHFNEMQKFVSNFMPAIRQKVELYHGDVPIFDAYSISTELSRALERKVWLKSGGYIVVDQAEALVAIDVNTGRYVGKKNLEDTILKTNLEAVQEIAYQLRLRNCGGIIILDLIDMEKEENKQRVYRALEEALKKDRSRPSIMKISDLGLVEMTRKRTRDTIVRSLCDSCAHCEGKGFIKSKQTVAYEVLREIERSGIERDTSKILVQANPEVIDILAIEERETLDQLERRYRKQIYLQAVTDYHLEQFEVTNDKKPRKDAQQQEEDRNRWSKRSGRGSQDRNERYSRNDKNSRGSRQERSGGTPGVIIPVTPFEKSGDPGSTSQDLGSENQGMQSNSGTDSPISPVSPITPVMGRIIPVGEMPGSDAVPGNSASVPMLVGPGPGGGFEHEEDRLAYLRAHAAQDAAIAKYGSGAAGAAPGQPNSGGSGGGVGGRPRHDNRGPRRDNNRGGRNNNRRGGRGGSGGGKFGPSRGGYSFRPPVSNGPQGPSSGIIPVGNPDPGPKPEAPAAAPAAPTTESSGTSGGGGSDRSNPPT
ncbi:MAG: Rne/Rng family ribonuclease, partial [Bdellovibrionota bacterium]